MPVVTLPITVDKNYASGAVFAGTFIASYMVMRRLLRSNSTRKNLPPSVGTVPLLGSIPYITDWTAMHLDFEKKIKSLGPVFSFQLGGSYTVVLNNHDLMREAYVKKAADFADRPYFAINSLINPNYKGIADAFYDAEFKKNRQLSVSILKKFGFGSNLMEQRINEEVELLVGELKRLNNEPVDPKDLVCGAILNIISSIVFGNRATDSKEVTRILFDFVRVAFNESVRLLILEFFPWLQYVPPYRGIAKKLTESNEEAFRLIYRKIGENSEENVDENFVSCYIKEEGENLDKEQLAFTIRDLMLAGIETSSNALMWSIGLLANHPDVQLKARKAIDAAVERNRLPSLSDKASLAYIEALMLEVLRYRTLFPLGAPHATLCDTEVAGYFIPNKAMVLVNVYAAHMDPEAWQEPEKFNPERFLDEAGNIVDREKMVVFSMGKRSCLGEILARQEVFLFLAALIQRFEILPPEGVSKLELKEEVTFVLKPECYRVRFVARSD